VKKCVSFFLQRVCQNQHDLCVSRVRLCCAVLLDQGYFIAQHRSWILYIAAQIMDTLLCSTDQGYSIEQHRSGMIYFAAQIRHTLLCSTDQGYFIVQHTRSVSLCFAAHRIRELAGSTAASPLFLATSSSCTSSARHSSSYGQATSSSSNTQQVDARARSQPGSNSINVQQADIRARSQPGSNSINVQQADIRARSKSMPHNNGSGSEGARGAAAVADRSHGFQRASEHGGVWQGITCSLD